MIGWRELIKLTAAALMLAGLSACAGFPQVKPKPTPSRLPFSYAEAVSPAPKETPLHPAATVSDQDDEDRLVYYRGVIGTLAASGPVADALAGRTLELSFVDAPVADVARAILAESLGLPLTIADGVGGTITLTALEPVPAAEALAALETALSESGLALIRTDIGFLLTTAANAGGRSQALRSPGSGYVGYGVTIAPVRYAAPSELATLIEPFISNRVTVTADDERGALILQGAQTEVESALDAIRSFDTPYLTDRIFGMFKLRYTDAQTIRAELDAIAAANGVASADLIALPRLNLLFVTARTQEAFREAREWIERLDQPSGGDERRMRYYPVQNTPADVLAAQLNAAFTGESSAFSSEGGSSPGGGLETQGRTAGAGSSVQPTFQRSAPQGGANRATISTDEINNALIIRATDKEYREILELVAHMDIQSPQVLIEATIAEVTLNDDLRYGVRWFWENAESALTLSDNDQGAVGPVFPGFSYSYFESNARVALNLLASVTDVTVLSAPSIMVLNNQSANLQVGDEVPVVTQTAQSVVDNDAPIVSAVQLRETGVILEVKPRINASDIVVLDITQEVSDVAETTTSGIDSPTIQQRRFTSTVAVRNNGTVALGGLIRESYTDNESGVPILKDIPGLGYAFKSRDITKRRTELIIFLTPRIIRTDEDAQNAIRYISREMQRLGAEEPLTQ
jgi:general secretion pathway protein D